MLASESLGELWWDLSFAQRLACCLPAGMRALGAERLKLSRAEQAFLVRADRLADSAITIGLLGPHWARSAYHLGDVAFLHALQAAVYSENSDKWPVQNTEDQAAQLRQIVSFQPPPCPISGRDVEKRLGLFGPAVGACLDRLGEFWAETDLQRQRTSFWPVWLTKIVITKSVITKISIEMRADDEQDTTRFSDSRYG